MRFMVGLPKNNPEFVNDIIKNLIIYMMYIFRGEIFLMDEATR